MDGTSNTVLVVEAATAVPWTKPDELPYDPNGMLPSLGGHFNPTGKPHGNPTAPDHHTGDLPMLVADASGNASLSTELGAMTVGSGATDIVGKAVIVHKDPDDYTTQPTGNSGGRVACGLIARN